MALDWFRVDTTLPSHPRVLDLVGSGTKGKAAGFVYICSIAYCTTNSTDGHLKRGALPLMHGTPADARLLVEAGLWVPTDEGWQIPNWADRQQMKSTTDAIRAARSAAGKAGAAARWGNGE